MVPLQRKIDNNNFDNFNNGYLFRVPHIEANPWRGGVETREVIWYFVETDQQL